MLGLVVFLLLALVPVTVNVLADRGSGERRSIRKYYYGRLLALMAEFEKTGGRVQEIDDNTAAARREMRRIVAGPWVVALILTLGLTWPGLSVWVPASVIGLWAVGIGAMAWLVSELFSIADVRMPATGAEISGAIVALSFKGLLVAGGVVTAHHGVARVNDGDWSFGLTLMASALGLIAYCHLPVRVVDSRLQRRREVDFARTTKTDAMLFLRSFQDDDQRFYSPYGSLGPRHRLIPGRQRFEELVLATLVGRSELVGVGEPGERRPRLGASRTYWDHDNWKDAISSTASRTVGLLVVAGKTPSLRWELTQLSELGLLGKTLILFPPDDPGGTAERYAHVDAALAFEELHRLPDELKVTLSAIAFDATGRPIHYLAGGRDWSSYVTTLLHFQLALDGELQFEAEGAVAEAIALADDPFEQAAYLLGRGERELAGEILNEAATDESDPSVLIGRAWERVALRGDIAGARQLVSGVSAVEDKAMLRRALEALDAVEHGGEHRAVLRARYSDRLHEPIERVRVGTAKLNRRAALGFRHLMERIGTAQDAQDHDAAYAHSLELVEFAESVGISTFIAMARFQLGDTELARGNLDSAELLLRQAVSLRGAPRVIVSPLMPRLDPVEVVAEALTSLAELSGRANDDEKRNAVLRELLEFHTSYGTLEDAAGAADELGRRHAGAGDYETAMPLLDRARADYVRAGRLAEAGWMMRWLAQVEIDQGNLEAALAWADQALSVAATADDMPLRLEALQLAGSAHESLGRRDGVPEHRGEALAHYESAVGSARELVEAVTGLRPVADEVRRDHLLRLSKALIHLGSFLRDDLAAARSHYEEALSIRRALVTEVPDDYWLKRRVAYARLYLAIDARQLESEAAPSAWCDVIGDFASLTSARDHKTSATDFASVLEHFVGCNDSSPPCRPEVEAVAASLASIRPAIQRVVEQVDPEDAYRTTRAVYGLAEEFRRISYRGHAARLYADIVAVRRELSGRNPEVSLYRRGVAFALLTADVRCLPDDTNSALGDLQEAISIFEELASTSEEASRSCARADLLTGLRHAGGILLRVAPSVALELADRAVVVAREQLASEPMEATWKDELGHALELGGRSASKIDAAEALRRFRDLISLEPDDGYPAWPHWSALVRSAFLLEKEDACEGLRYYESALGLVKAQLRRLRVMTGDGNSDAHWPGLR